MSLYSKHVCPQLSSSGGRKDYHLLLLYLFREEIILDLLCKKHHVTHTHIQNSSNVIKLAHHSTKHTIVSYQNAYLSDMCTIIMTRCISSAIVVGTVIIWPDLIQSIIMQSSPGWHCLAGAGSRLSYRCSRSISITKSYANNIRCRLDSIALRSVRSQPLRLLLFCF